MRWNPSHNYEYELYVLCMGYPVHLFQQKCGFLNFYEVYKIKMFNSQENVKKIFLIIIKL